jgi:hypothetical protein
LQESSRIGTTIQIDEAALERLFEEDRSRVARVEVKQAMKLAELMKAAIEEQKMLTHEDGSGAPSWTDEYSRCAIPECAWATLLLSVQIG